MEKKTNKYKMILKDGECPKCGEEAHGMNDGPMKCNHCGWVQDEEEAKCDTEKLDMLFHKELPEEDPLIDFRRCRVCGCTDDYACPGGCYWIEENLCSACAGITLFLEDR